ncbi:MAG: SMP-30/gluconolactonase/LRE family protein, partial [Verrucomicrobiota bacterium]|nr:SMP-30/gluconolactonase/LRE family protein [Verrucomicrobiota bacterium]
GPNDLWIRPDGALYFTDPLYPRDYWERSADMQQDGQHVYFLAKGSSQPVQVTDDLEQPNGLIGTPDGKLLYVADIRGRKTYRYDIEKNGHLTNKQLFCSLGSDGMTLDDQGNVYLTGRGVSVYNPQGERIQHIAIPSGWTANVTFGGKDRNLLFITASRSVYTIEMKTRGAGPF